MWPITAITAQLPHGLGNNYITACAFARSALFSTQGWQRHGRPRYTQRTQLATAGAMTIYQLFGYQLDQNDGDVFYELLRQVFAQGDGDKREARIRCRRIDLLRALGRTPGGKSRKLLDESIERLTLATYEFSIPGLATGMSRLLLKTLRRDRDEIEGGADGPDYDILLDLELAKLFQFHQWVLLSKDERDKLMDDALARGLHTYYASHKEPWPVLPSTLKELMGRDAMREDKWLAALKASLARLRAATGWKVCELSTTGKTAGKVVVVKKKAPKLPSSKKVPKSMAAPAPEAAPMPETAPAVRAVPVPKAEAEEGAEVLEISAAAWDGLARIQSAEQLYRLTRAEAEQLMPPVVLQSWHARLARDPSYARDPHEAPRHLMWVWLEVQRVVNPQLYEKETEI